MGGVWVGVCWLGICGVGSVVVRGLRRIIWRMGWGVRLACGVYVLLDLGACGALFVCATGGGRLLLPFRGMELGVGDALCYIDVSVRFDSLSLLFSGHDFFFLGGGGEPRGTPVF